MGADGAGRRAQITWFWVRAAGVGNGYSEEAGVGAFLAVTRVAELRW